MPLHLYLSGRHIATLTPQHLTMAALVAAVLLLFGVYVNVLQQAVEQGHRHAAQAQADVSTTSTTSTTRTALAAPAAR